MRLQNPASKQKGLTGPNADIVDQLLTNKKKRSRPISSSLEFQAPDRNLITTAKSTSAKNKARAKNHQQPPPQITATRARGSGGIPKMKLQLQDLEGMAEDEILQALYEDPELAAAAAADTNHSQHSKDPPLKTSRRQQKLSKYSTHVKDMTDQGIPYKQWIILLLLLGVAAYQIYKSLKPPQTSKKRGGSKGVNIPKKAKSVGDKVKRKKAETKKSVAVKAKIQNPADTKVEPAIPAVDNSAESPDTKPRDKTTATSAKKKAKAPATKTAKPPGIAEKKVQHPESPDSVSTDGSSSSNDGAAHVPSTSKEVKEKKSVEEKKASIKSGGSKKNGRIEESVEGWQIIGEKPSPFDASSAPKNGVSSNRDLPAKSQTGQYGKSLTASLEEAKVANDENSGMKAESPSKASAKGDNAHEKAKRNRKKKTKTENSVASSVISAPATDDDAVIALKLQKEEEKLAEATDRAESEPEVWKEVATKKRKGAAPMEVATTDQSDAVNETS